MSDFLKKELASGRSILTAIGEMVTHPDELEAALDRAASAPKPGPQTPTLAGIGVLQDQITMLRGQNGDLTTQVDNLTGEKAALTTQVATLTDQVASLDELQAKYDAAAAQVQSLQSSVDSLTAENAQLSDQIAALTTENETLQQQIDAVATDLNDDGTIDDLEKMTVPDLKELAKSLSIDGADGLKKADLVAAIRAKQAEQAAPSAGGE